MLKALGAGLQAAAEELAVGGVIYGAITVSCLLFLRYVVIPRMRRKTLDEIRKARREDSQAGQR